MQNSSSEAQWPGAFLISNFIAAILEISISLYLSPRAIDPFQVSGIGRVQ